MSAIGAVSSHLVHDPVVGLRVGFRVYRMVAARKAVFPYIVLQVISVRPVRHMTAAAGLRAQTVQLSCWAATADEMDALADEVRKSLDHRHHEDIGYEPDVVTLTAAFLESEIERTASAVGGGSVFGKIQTWTIWHKETVPVFV